MPLSLVQEFHRLLDDRLDVQDVVVEAQHLLLLSKPITTIYCIIREIIWYVSLKIFVFN